MNIVGSSTVSDM